MDARPTPRDWLGVVERLGNRLPDPATLFALAAVSVVVGSKAAVASGWTVDDPRKPGEVAVALDLLTPTELGRAFTHSVSAFLDFAPLGIVLVAMLGIGVAEKVGLFGAAMRALVAAVPDRLLVPTVVFTGVMANLTADAGYVILPPLAAALFVRSGRPAAAGIAAVTFAIANGYAANLLITSLDPLLSGITEQAARLTDPAAVVAPTCNWWFKIGSTFLLTAVGWGVTERVILPRLASTAPTSAVAPEPLQPAERRGLALATVTAILVVAVWGAAVFLPDGPLSGTVEKAGRTLPRWSESLAPLMLVAFLLPAIVYGALTGRVKSDRDVASAMSDAMASMSSYVVLAFFAGQFISLFQRSNLPVLVAVDGGAALGSLGMPIPLLLAAIVLGTAGLDLLIASASAKWALLAPVLVPVFGQVGLSPALVQAAYRVGDSLANPMSPLNPYLVIVLVELRRHVPGAGLGTLMSLLLPYTLVALVSWTLFLIGWVALGIPLGP